MRRVNFIDCGAHVGECIPEARKRYGDGVRIYCFEPVPCMANYIHDQYRDDPLVTVTCAAVSSRNGTAKLFQNMNTYSATLCAGKRMNVCPGMTLDVPTVRLDQFIGTLEGRVILKMNIEGAEYDILESIAADDIDGLYVSWHSKKIQDRSMPEREIALMKKFSRSYRGQMRLAASVVKRAEAIADSLDRGQEPCRAVALPDVP